MTKIVSNFNKDADGWAVSGDPKSDGWIKTDGDPGGYFGWVNGGNGQEAYYVAPAKFLGNDKAYYGGTLSYDVVAHANGDQPYLDNYADVILYDGTHELIAISRIETGSTWTGEIFSLKAGDLYDLDSSGHTSVASKAEIKEVLGHLTVLAIRAEYYGDAETGGIDNVILNSTGFSKPSSTGADAADLDARWIPGLGHLGDADHACAHLCLGSAHFAIA